MHSQITCKLLASDELWLSTVIHYSMKHGRPKATQSSWELVWVHSSIYLMVAPIHSFWYIWYFILKTGRKEDSVEKKNHTESCKTLTPFTNLLFKSDKWLDTFSLPHFVKWWNYSLFWTLLVTFHTENKWGTFSMCFGSTGQRNRFVKFFPKNSFWSKRKTSHWGFKKIQRFM